MPDSESNSNNANGKEASKQPDSNAQMALLDLGPIIARMGADLYRHTV